MKSNMDLNRKRMEINVEKSSSWAYMGLEQAEPERERERGVAHLIFPDAKLKNQRQNLPLCIINLCCGMIL